MQIKSSKKKFRWVLSTEVKRKLWLKLPYPLRLRIEHRFYVGSVIYNNWNSIEVKFLPALRKSLYRKCFLWLKEVKKLNNPYVPFINAPISDASVKRNIDAFLARFNH